MPLETATYISDLNTSNPAHTDGLSQADSHMRLTKAALKNTFPNFTAAALSSTQAQLDAAVAAIVTASAAGRFNAGTAALPGLTPVGDPDTGILSPAANQIAVSLAGAQVLLMGGTALVTTLGVAAAAFTTSGAYSGGTGQLVPIGAVLEWYDDVLPTEGGYAWANGQIIASANTVCPVLLARWGTRFGGNGITTMGVPDRRDTVGVGKSTMGGITSRGLQTLSNTVLGTLIGVANTVLGIANLPPITSTQTGIAVNVTSSQNGVASGNTRNDASIPNTGPFYASYNAAGQQTIGQITSSGSINVSVSSTGTLSTAVNNVQPSTTCNYIVRLG